MIKVDVVSGFLGAGKTTLIKKLFESKLASERVVIIENEFGEIGIDGAFLKDSGVMIKEINSGCICCSLVGDFSTSMNEVISRFSPERIIIEPSGVGKLSDIIRAIERVEQPLTLNIIVTVVDGGKCRMYANNFGEFYLDQVKQARTVIVSRADKLSDEKIATAVQLIKNINDKCTIITTPIGELNADVLLSGLEAGAGLLDDFVQSLKDEHEHCCHHHHEDEDEHEHCCHHHHEDEDEDEHEHHCHHHEDEDEDEHEHHCHHHEDEDEHEHCCHHEGEHHHHDADEVFTSVGIETVSSYTQSQLHDALSELCGDKYGVILRAKGILRAADNDKWYYFDYVSGDFEIRLGEPDIIGKLCVIGSGLDKAGVKALFKA